MKRYRMYYKVDPNGFAEEDRDGPWILYADHEAELELEKARQRLGPPQDTHDYSFVDSLERGDTRQRAALFAFTWGGVDGEHHKQWVIDQMLRELLTVAEYERFCQEYAADSNAHSPWNEGIAP